MTDLGNLKQRVVVLPNKRLNLKVLSSKDISEEYVSWLNNYEIVQFTEQKYIEHNRETVIDFVNRKYNSNLDLLFGIFFDARHIGNIKLGPIDFNHRVSDVSFFIGEKNMWGRGLMTQVIEAVVGIAFGECGLDKVTAGAYANNIGSIRALEKNGFLLEGRRVKQILFEGKRIDAVIYGKKRKGAN
jgi:RimJ/RimL family protein N-acetyltransferase